MSKKPVQNNRGKSAPSRRVGRVTIYLRRKVWYLYYAEHGRRVRRRVGSPLAEAKQLAAQTNAQLATGAPAMLSFEPLAVAELRQRWLDHHEHVLRSSIATIRRYRAATDHLLRFIENGQAVGSADRLTLSMVEKFVRYLRQVEISPNGYPNTAKRSLRDKGIIFILESCRAMFNYAAKHRHLPPYHENPFAQIDIERIPIEDAKPIELFTPKQEAAFGAACDHWQFPIFLTLALTGMRPGEPTHLLIPDDVDLTDRLIRVRNKPELGWRTKTRSERDILMVEELCEVLCRVINDRQTGPLFLRRQFSTRELSPILANYNRKRLVLELSHRVETHRVAAPDRWTRFKEARVAKSIWRDAGAIKEVDK